jgi:copper chaperone CopZ
MQRLSKEQNLTKALLCSLLAWASLQTWGFAQTAQTGQNPHATQAPLPAVSRKEEGAPPARSRHYNPNALRRLDFRIEGKSCPVCLLGVQNRVKAVEGAVQVAVMLKKPFGASVIYDGKQVDQQRILTAAKLTEPMIKLVDIQDEAIEKLPTVLIPPHSGMPAPSLDGPQSNQVKP